jgi:16S rRNA processing protein RimM
MIVSGEAPNGASSPTVEDEGAVQVVVGRVGRAHGIRGDVAVDVRTDDPGTRFAAGAVLLTDPEAVGPLTVASGQAHSGRLLLRFVGVTDRTAAEALRGTWLLAERDDSERLADPDEFYDEQLVGLAVVSASGEAVGEVAEMLHLSMQDVLTVRRPDGSEVLVPFVRQIVPDVDLDRRQITIDPPPGLLGEPADDALGPEEAS